MNIQLTEIDFNDPYEYASEILEAREECRDCGSDKIRRYQQGIEWIEECDGCGTTFT